MGGISDGASGHFRTTTARRTVTPTAQGFRSCVAAVTGGAGKTGEATLFQHYFAVACGAGGRTGFPVAVGGGRGDKFSIVHRDRRFTHPKICSFNGYAGVATGRYSGWSNIRNSRWVVIKPTKTIVQALSFVALVGRLLPPRDGRNDLTTNSH